MNNTIQIALNTIIYIYKQMRDSICKNCNDNNWIIQCGCNQCNKTMTKYNNGRIRLFLRGHYSKINPSMKGKTHTEESKKLISEKTRGKNNPNYNKTMSDKQRMKISLSRIGKYNKENHPMWNKFKNNPTIATIHDRIKRRKPKPELCEICKNKPPRDLVNISITFNPKTYNNSIGNWKWICRSCHIKSDNRIMNIKKMNRSGKAVLV